jgi:3-hydroxyisobutyrate dehydrogenase-like beta-hydroxyacid dehydrogenase
MKIGFIGLGTMGNPMAGSLIKADYQLVVSDLRKETAGQLITAGASWADTPKVIADAGDIIFTSLPGPQEVEAVALGKNGIIEGISPGKAYIDLSSNSPATVRAIYQRFKAKGADVIDSPVSGGPGAAKTGKLAMMVGGDQAVFEKYEPVLKVLGDKITYCGDIGCGSICKLMHNCALYTLQTAVAECLTLGVKAGVDPKALWKVLRDGAVGQGVLFQRSLPETYFLGKFEPPNFALKLAFKDVSLATSLGKEFGVPMATSNLAFHELLSAMNRGWGDRDSRSAMLLQEERSGGIQVRMPKSDIIKESPK